MMVMFLKLFKFLKTLHSALLILLLTSSLVFRSHSLAKSTIELAVNGNLGQLSLDLPDIIQSEKGEVPGTDEENSIPIIIPIINPQYNSLIQEQQEQQQLSTSDIIFHRTTDDLSTPLPQSMSFMSASDGSCQIVKVLQILQRPSCQTKVISTFACSGVCPSYVQVSNSREWEHDRSCSCCQQTSLQEETFVLDCPALNPPYQEVKTYAPVECICRSCSDLSRENLRPQELVEALEGQSSVRK